MSLFVGASKKLARLRPLALQARFSSHSRSKGDVDFSEFGRLTSSGPGANWMLWIGDQKHPDMAHLPTISGDDVSFPWHERVRSSDGADADHMHSFGTGVDFLHTSLHSRGDVQTVDSKLIQDIAIGAVEDQKLNEECLQRFEVPGSAEIAQRLFHNVEVRAMLARSQVAEKRAASALPRKKVFHTKPAVSDGLAASFGSTQNVVAVVCRFAKLARDVAGADSRQGKVDAVTAGVQDIVGSLAFGQYEVDSIVDALSEEHHAHSCREASYLATGIVRFLAFENIWQRLSGDQRQRVMDAPAGCGNLPTTSEGLVQGLKVFVAAWQRMSDAQQRFARINLCALAQQHH